jgi:uncharacterized protein
MMQVAVIGAGVSGLSLAYELQKQSRERAEHRPHVTIFEKAADVGGNCKTRRVAFGGEFEVRFVDLGVNDFNARTYVNVVRAMDEIGFRYSLLEDSACFFQSEPPPGYDPYRGDYTSGGEPYYGMSLEMQVEYARFKTCAPATYNRLGADACFGFSIQDYLLGSPEFPAPDGAYSQNFVDRCILPRVNAMYFCDDRVPCGAMPFGAVMHYYMLQEGMGSDYGPLRMYFDGGSQRWTERLAERCGARILTGANVTGISAKGGPGGRYRVGFSAGNRQHSEDFDAVVFALPPYAMGELGPLPPAVAAMKQRFSENLYWAQSTAYAHTWSGLLPADANFWRSYNVGIRDHTRPQPYSMTYLENRHQNDARNAAYDRFGLPVFFTTLNPVTPIPEPYILKEAMGPDPDHPQPVTAEFPHFVLDEKAYRFQRALLPEQGRDGVYYAGGWCYFSGLHEECWVYSKAIAADILLQAGDASRAPFGAELGTEALPGHIRTALRARR